MAQATSTPQQPIYYRRIEEHVIEGKPLGRHVLHDERSKAYPAEMAPIIADADHESWGLPLNQGSVGACTAFATSASANTAPNYSGPLALPHLPAYSYPHTNGDALTLYTRETTDEGQPYPANDPGGTGLAVCKAARELGWIARYAHAFSLDAALRALVLRSVITGINWYDSFDSPDSHGVITISPDAQVRGGHEICASQIIVADQMVGLWQSWGEWGLNGTGRFFMSFSTWDRLLSEQGDVTVPAAAVAR